MLGRAEFRVGHSLHSETSRVESVIGRWQSNGERYFNVTDTPGIGDSKDRDNENLANMVIDCNKIGYAYCFLLVINSNNMRFDQ